MTGQWALGARAAMKIEAQTVLLSLLALYCLNYDHLNASISIKLGRR